MKLDLGPVLVAESDETSEQPSHTPRYELSWFYDDVDPDLIEQCLRPRQRANLPPEECDWLYHQLCAMGHEANADANHFLAHAWFECAFNTKAEMASLISRFSMHT